MYWKEASAKPSPCSFSIRPRFMCARATAAMGASASGGRSSSSSAALTGATAASGGDVIVECVANLNTLLDYRYQQHFKAKKGGHGKGENRSGARGADVVLKVPPGTQILDEDNETLIADLTKPGDRVVLLARRQWRLRQHPFQVLDQSGAAPRQSRPAGRGAEYLAEAQADRRCGRDRPAQCRQVHLPGAR